MVKPTTPATYPQTPPNPVEMPLQQHAMLFEMHNTLGKVEAKIDRLVTDSQSHAEKITGFSSAEAKIDRLIADVKSQGEKLDKVRIWMAWATGAGVCVGVLVTFIINLLRFLPTWPAGSP